MSRVFWCGNTGNVILPLKRWCKFLWNVSHSNHTVQEHCTVVSVWVGNSTVPYHNLYKWETMLYRISTVICKKQIKVDCRIVSIIIVLFLTRAITTLICNGQKRLHSILSCVAENIARCQKYITDAVCGGSSLLWVKVRETLLSLAAA